MSAVEKFHEIKNMDKESIYTVYGFIRDSQKMLPKNKPYYNIPELINKICLIFYYDNDEWDKKYISSGMKLVNKNCLVQTQINYKSSFGKRIIKSGKKNWKFRIEKCQYESWGILIGIWKIESEKEPPTETYFTHRGDNAAYAFNVDYAKLVNKRGSGHGRDYGIKCKDGDIIDMYLDMNNLTLSFAINNKHYGKAFDIEDTPYRLAVMMQDINNSITML